MSEHRKNRLARADKGLHPRNLHKNGYDFTALVRSCSTLGRYVETNQYGNESINFADPSAVKALNCALLKHHYGVHEWDIPQGFLCPPVPGRVDYIHYVADLFGGSKKGVRLLDIGTGANGIYSILGCQVYGWHCTASDIDPVSIGNLRSIISKNVALQGRLEVRLQRDKGCIFKGVLLDGEHYDVSVCNPPFHASLKEALKGTQKKINNLVGNNDTKPRASAEPTLNFGGQKAELWCNGGEIRFLRRMLKESKVFGSQCRWFTTLISKSENVKLSTKLLRKLAATEIKKIEMKQGNKITRILVWTFFG